MKHVFWLIYTILGQFSAVTAICLTWNVTKDHVFIRCHVFGLFSLEQEILLTDSSDRNRAKCFIYDSPKCTAREHEDVILEKSYENSFTLVLQTAKEDVEGNWKCFHGSDKADVNIHLIKGIVYAADIHLSGEIIEKKTKNKFKLTCYSCWVPDTESVNFFVNGGLEDSVRYKNGKCYQKRRLCSPSECTCSNEGNLFTWSFSSDLTILEFSCEMRFKGEETSTFFIQTANLSFNESVFQQKQTTKKTFAVSNKAKPIEGGNKDVLLLVFVTSTTTVAVLLLVMGITIGSILILKNVRQGRLPLISGTKPFTTMSVKENAGNTELPGKIQAGIINNEIEENNDVNQAESSSVCRDQRQSHNKQVQPADRRKRTKELPMKDETGAIEMDVIGKDKIKTTVGQIETEKNFNVALPETSVTHYIEQKSRNGQEQSVVNVNPGKRTKTLSFSQILCDICSYIPVYAVCINCRKIYCKSCYGVHTESEKDHKMLHIPHVDAGNQEIICGKCEKKKAEQLCAKCLNLMCESCSDSQVHAGCEGTKMMIIYQGHPKLLRQKSENKLRYFQDLSIEQREERYPIHVCGISYIADGRLVIVDKRNRNLLVFKSNEEKIRTYLEEEPHALTSMTGQHIAITFPFEMEIRIYKIAENSIDKLNIIGLSALKLDNLKPYSIAFDSDFFVVEVGEGDDGKIIVINGTKIHKEIENKNFAYFTGHTIRLALEVKTHNPLEGRIFISALSKNVVLCVDFQGKVVWKQSIPSPRGISVVPAECTPGSNLVVCSRLCNAIFGLNKDNGEDKQIILSEGKIKLPRFISYNSKDRLLCIQVAKGDNEEKSVSFVEFRAPPQSPFYGSQSLFNFFTK